MAIGRLRIQLDTVRELERSEDLLGELLDDGLDAVTQASPACDRHE